jgi:hypothetical protein
MIGQQFLLTATRGISWFTQNAGFSTTQQIYANNTKPDRKYAEITATKNVNTKIITFTTNILKLQTKLKNTPKRYWAKGKEGKDKSQITNHKNISLAFEEPVLFLVTKNKLNLIR